MRELTDITVILDRSGSMASCVYDTIGGFNTFLKDQQQQPGEAVMTLVQFDNEYQVDYQSIPIKEVQPLNTETYVPRGSTALLDAIGRTIVSVGNRLALLPEADRPNKVMIIIQTDGEENQSREFSHSRIMEMIKEQREKYNWDFTFLGAGQDAIATGAAIGVLSNKCLSYDINNTQATFKSMSNYTNNIRSIDVNAISQVGYSDEDRRNVLL